MEKIELIHGTTGLYRLNYSIGNINIYMKRDDLLDFAFGGNKVRLFEYIGAMVKKKNADKIITFGSVYSNHIRVAAAVAAKLKVKCDLIVLTTNKNNKISNGNGKLISYYGANVIYCAEENAHEFIDEYLKHETKKQINYFWIPGGGHMAEAGFGYVDAFNEIREQMEKLKVTFDAIFLPTGTGTTQAGMIYGAYDTNCDIYGVTVARTKERCCLEIEKMLEEMSRLENKEEKIFNNKIHVLDNAEQSYGMVDGKITQIIEEIAFADGIFLDPIYNAKAFCGMISFLEENKNYQNVLFLNTGGSPNLFAD